MNNVVLIGRCGRDPEVRAVGQGKVAEFSLATSKPPKNKGDQWPTEWHSIELWNRAAEKAEAKLRKGDLVCVVGEIKTRSWDDKDGIKRYKTTISTSWADNVVIEIKETQDNQSTQESW